MRNTEGKPSTALTPLRNIPESEPPEQLAVLARQYPGLLIAGGLALGLLAGALVPRRAGSKFAQRAVTIAAAAGELGLALSRHAREGAGKAARDGKERLGRDSAAMRQRASRLAENAKGTSVRLAEEAIRFAARHKS